MTIAVAAGAIANPELGDIEVGRPPQHRKLLALGLPLRLPC
jgi:hypothetical protein